MVGTWSNNDLCFLFLYLKRCLTTGDGGTVLSFAARKRHGPIKHGQTPRLAYIYTLHLQNCCELDNKLIRFVCTIVKWRQLNLSAQTETRKFKLPAKTYMHVMS